MNRLDERVLSPYSDDDLRKILESLRKASSNRVEDAIESESVLNRALQSLAFEYKLYRELETRPQFKNYREILKHIAAADFDALPDAIRNRVIPKEMSGSLSAFEQARRNALAILDSSPKRGALRKPARYDFVNELAN